MINNGVGGWSGIVHNGYSYVNAKELENTGIVSGVTNVGELYGKVWTDKASVVSEYTVLGSIEVSGERLEGTYDVGANYNFTLSGREIYEEPSGENAENAGESENPEGTPQA